MNTTTNRFDPLGSCVCALAALAVTTACGEPAEADGELTGVALLALSAPDGVGSVQVEFAGSNRSVTRCVAVDGASTTRLARLPTGAVVINAGAFEGPDCSGEALWLSDEQTTTFRPGQPTSVRITFRPNGIADVSTEFIVDELAAPVGCGADTVRVPREAMSLTAAGPAGTGLRAVYSDGDVRVEGPIDFGPYAAGNVPSYYPADVLADESAPFLWETIWGIGGETLTGYIVGPWDGPVTFTLSADDYASMDLGNGMFWIEADNTGVVTGTVELEAGVFYPVTIEYENRWGSNWFRFYWQCVVP